MYFLLILILTTAASTFAADKCWWTSCQTQGCGPKSVERAQRSCPYGTSYQCCERGPPPPPQQCWWSSCQPVRTVYKRAASPQTNQQSTYTYNEKQLPGARKIVSTYSKKTTSITYQGKFDANNASLLQNFFHDDNFFSKNFSAGFPPSLVDEESSEGEEDEFNSNEEDGDDEASEEDDPFDDEDIFPDDIDEESFSVGDDEFEDDGSDEEDVSEEDDETLDEGVCPKGSVAGETMDCGNGEVMYECCTNITDENSYQNNLLTDEPFEGLVQDLFREEKDYAVTSESLSCEMLDPEKKYAVKINQTPFRFCDLCPNLPQKQLNNVFLDRVPTVTRQNFPFPDCFEKCYKDKTCMALSYDFTTATCYLFDSTAGGYVADSDWVTVLMTQPSGIVQDWAYTRNTRLIGYLKHSSQLPSFQHCLTTCDFLKNCNYASYYLPTNNCSLFNADEDVTYIDSVYGHIAAIRISNTTSDEDYIDRYIAEGDALKVPKRVPEESNCTSFSNETHSAYYSRHCSYVGSSLSGCDQETGCRICYYPEETKILLSIPICPDSDYLRLNSIKAAIRRNMQDCLVDELCIGVGYNKEGSEVSTMTLTDFMQGRFETRYMLKLPPNTEKNFLKNYDLVPNAYLEPLLNAPDNFFIMSNQSFKQCVQIFHNKEMFIRFSYSPELHECRFGDERSAFVKTSSPSLVVFKKPSLLSPVLNYLRSPGLSIAGNPGKMVIENCDGNCETICSTECSSSYSEWCRYISIEQSAYGARCILLEDNDFDVIENKIGIVFTRISKMDFSLQSLDKLKSFQSVDFYNCFERNEQSHKSLKSFLKPATFNVRKTRNVVGDFFSGLWEDAKSLGESAVNLAVDTGKGIWNTGKDIVNGESAEKVWEDFTTIPSVKLGKDAVELVGAAVTGDGEEAGEKLNDILDSDIVNIASTVAVPGGAGRAATKVGKAGLKAVREATKKGTKKLAKQARKKFDDVADETRKVKNVKKQNSPKNETKKKQRKKENEEIERERGEKCDVNGRPKRAVKRNKKKRFGKPGNCKDDKDKKKEGKCPAPQGFKNYIKATAKHCGVAKVGRKCKYECNPGYKESKPEVQCSRQRNKAVWKPKAPKCTLENCQKGNEVTIVLQTPQVKKFGQVGLGDYITAFVVLFDKKRKLPIWSIALHQGDQFHFNTKNYNTAQLVDRRDTFTAYPCKELKKSQAIKKDYENTGLDRGHLTPANVARWSEKSRRVSNLYINVAPQDRYSNTVPWNHLESHIYCFSGRIRSVVATGVCSSSLKKKMGRIQIPTCFWKMVCYKDENNNHQVVGFYSGNSPAKTDAEKKARRIEIFTPLSQEQLMIKVGGSFSDVWRKSVTHLNAGRPVTLDGFTGVWFPVAVLACAQKTSLSTLEKEAWADAFQGRKNCVRRGKNECEPKPKGRSKRQAAKKIVRGCHSSEALQSALMSAWNIASNTDENAESESETDGDEAEDGDETSNDKKWRRNLGDGSVKVAVQKCGKRIVGYYTSWGSKQITGLQLQRLTHVIFAFLETHADGKISIGSPDRKNSKNLGKDIEKAQQRLLNLLQIAKRYPHVKVMFAVGGWENSQYFSGIASSQQKRLTFIASIIRMIEKYGFDGVDIDWEYPVTGGATEGVPADKRNYVLLMKELRVALDRLAGRARRREKFLISFAGAAGQWTLDPGFDLPGLLKYVDFVNIMSYDYFGPWASKWGGFTGAPSPLYFGMPTGFSGKTNLDWSVKYYTCKTKEPHKINMGVPFYGRYWKNVGAAVDGKDPMWRKAQSVNGKFEGDYTPWYDIQKNFLGNKAFQKGFHPVAKVPYAWSPTQKMMLGYENKESLQHKIKYAVDRNVGGVMIWALDQDDDAMTLLNTVATTPLCTRTNPKEINHRCSPINSKRWWTPENGKNKAGLCGRSAPLYRGYYPVCDPDDPAYGCCGPLGYCGSGAKFCDCPTCKNYRKDPKLILEAPIKPSIARTWYLMNDPKGKRGRCGKKVPKIGANFPTCNPDDPNAYCCSNGGYCGSTAEHCKCNGCVNFKTNPRFKFT